jgi:hypothetical protein
MRRPVIAIGWLLDAVSRSRFAAAIEACAIGLMLRLFDVHSTISIAPFPSFLAAGCALGLRHGGVNSQASVATLWCSRPNPPRRGEENPLPDSIKPRGGEPIRFRPRGHFRPGCAGAAGAGSGWIKALASL